MKTLLLVVLAIAAALVVYRRLGRWLDKISTRGVLLAIGAALVPLFMGAGAAITVIIGLIAYALST